MRVIYGGTFDPIHFGHILIAGRLASMPEVESVHVVVAGNPYHKSNRKVTDAYIRLNMVQLAFESWPKIIVEDIEVNKTTPSYSYDTVIELKNKYPTSEWALAHGTEAILNGDILKWHKIKELLSEVRFWPVQREKSLSVSDIIPIQELVGEKIAHQIIKDIIIFPSFSISSTKIRSIIDNSQDCSAFVPSQAMTKEWLHQNYGQREIMEFRLGRQK